MNSQPSHIKTEWISVPSHDGQAFDAYLALPPAGSGPGLVLYQEIFGVNSHIRAVAEQYALAGFVVLAPDVFWRQARRIELGYEGPDWERAIKFIPGIDPALMGADVKTIVAALRARPEVGSRKVGAFGYCLGGRLAYTAAAITDVDAAVAFYGGGIQDQLALAENITAPMLFHYGALDTHIPLEAVDKVRAAFADKPATFHVYEGAEHGFNCWMRGSYNAGASALALGRSMAFFAQRLF
jgi:carboxymethylenebutenolidase